MTEAEPRVNESLLGLLNTAFEGWGDESYFRFKYTDFPGYDPAEHDFLVERDGRLVAARRVFVKRIVTGDGRRRPVHVHGGAVVHPDYRRQGLFTDLVDESREYSRDAGSPVVMTFNRRGKLSTQAHMRRDWQYRTLPLHIRPLSPGPLIDEHAADVLPEFRGVDSVTTLAGAAADIVLPDWAIGRGVELATSGISTRPITPYGRDAPRDDDVDVRPYEPDDIEAVGDLFDDELRGFDLAFARDREHIEHMVGYDRAETVVAVREGDVVGFACVGAIDRGEHLEARVFDLVHATDAVGDRLIEWAETSARERGADVVSILRDERPGPAWASLRTDLVMWDYLQDRDKWHRLLSDGTWRITAYDVV